MNKLSHYILVLAAVLVSSSSSSAKELYSSSIGSDDVTDVCNAVLKWQMDNFHAVSHPSNDWTNAALYVGMLKWADATGNESVYDFVRQRGEETFWSLRVPVYHADNICVGQSYMALYKRYGDPRMIQSTVERAYYIANHPILKPKKRTERWGWCDALFMAPPVYAELYTMTGEQCYLDYLANEYRYCYDALYDKDAKLFFRDELRIPNREPNGAKEFWGRGEGWVLGGLTRLIDILPETVRLREFFISLFQEICSSVLDAQCEDGSWHTSLLAPEFYPYPENSCSTFFCYSFAWGINRGYLDSGKYLPALKRGWKSIVNCIDEAGRLGFVQPVGYMPVNGVRAEDTEVYAVGALLLAGSELLKIGK